MAKLTGVTGDEGSWNAIVTPLWEGGERRRRIEGEEKRSGEEERRKKEQGRGEWKH